jgi:ATP synthase protein I
MGSRDDDPRSRSTDEAALFARLRRLGQRLEAGRPREVNPAPRPAADVSAFTRGLRLSTGFVAGVIGGAALGWLIDYGLGTSPWGLIVLLMLGFAVGVVNVVRGAGSTSGGFGDGAATRKD